MGRNWCQVTASPAFGCIFLAPATCCDLAAADFFLLPASLYPVVRSVCGAEHPPIRRA